MSVKLPVFGVVIDEIFGLKKIRANPLATSRDAVVEHNITLNATLSTPLRFIDRYEWRVCYLDKGRCRDEKIFRSYDPLINVSVDRSGEYRAILKIYVGNETDESSGFNIRAKSASEEKSVIAKNTPEEISANVTGTNTSTSMTTTRTKSLETEMTQETPAPGILSAMIILCLAWYVKKRR